MTNIDRIRSYCLAKPTVSESFPFDNDTLVFKVNAKIFAMLSLVTPYRLTLKCKPELAVELREQYAYVRPGYHMNKHHWNTIDLDAHPSPTLLFEWIDHSYALIVSGKK